MPVEAAPLLVLLLLLLLLLLGGASKMKSRLPVGCCGRGMSYVLWRGGWILHYQPTSIFIRSDFRRIHRQHEDKKEKEKQFQGSAFSTHSDITALLCVPVSVVVRILSHPWRGRHREEEGRCSSSRSLIHLFQVHFPLPLPPPTECIAV